MTRLANVHENVISCVQAQQDRRGSQNENPQDDPTSGQYRRAQSDQPASNAGKPNRKRSMPRLSQDASTILSRMKALHVDAGDYVLVDAFMSLLEDNEHRVGSALDELIKLRLVVVTHDKDALAMTKAGARFWTDE